RTLQPAAATAGGYARRPSRSVQPESDSEEDPGRLLAAQPPHQTAGRNRPARGRPPDSFQRPSPMLLPAPRSRIAWRALDAGQPNTNSWVDGRRRSRTARADNAG